MTTNKAATDALTGISARLKLALHEAARPEILRPLGEKACDLIRRRTRLGYGVDGYGQERFAHTKLSAGYIHFRQRVADGLTSFPGGRGLSSMTTARRSNLTATGQMLDSLSVITIRRGSVVVGPTGMRADGKSNAFVAAKLLEIGRPFNFLSRLEQEQLVRFYRNKFGDLLRNRRLKP